MEHDGKQFVDVRPNRISDSVVLRVFKGGLSTSDAKFSIYLQSFNFLSPNNF
jgi:hypothetical protein